MGVMRSAPLISGDWSWHGGEGGNVWGWVSIINQRIGCAGRAGEEMMYGGDEVSTINQRRLVLARRIVTKLVVSNAMSDTPELADRMISHPVRHGERSLRQVILRKVRPSPAL